ncbi:hypothetical protein BGZ46_000497, partial [Entomortierella lignicola]
HRTETMPGSKSEFEWYETWVCHRSGKPRTKSTAEIENAKSRERYKDNSKTGCDAVIYVHKFKPSVTHPDDNCSSPDHRRISEQLRIQIYREVGSGLTNRQILVKLTLSVEELHSRLAKGILTRDNFVTSDNVANIANSFWKEKAELCNEEHKSVCMWMDRLQENGYFVFRAQNGQVVDKLVSKKCISVGFSSPWQLEKFREYPDAIGLDSTHGDVRSKSDPNNANEQGPGVNKKVKFELFTIIIQDSRTMRDDSATERCAIQSAFGYTVRIYLCLWHVARAWSQKIQALVSDVNDWESKLQRYEARKTLRDIMYEPDLLRARELIQAFRDDWGNRSPEFAKYMKVNYFNSETRMKSWMKAYRQREFYAEMDTNNFVESWHNLLKNHFMKGHFRSRVDRVVYLLDTKVLRYYKLDEFQINVRVGRKSKGEIMDILCQRKVKNISDETIQKHVCKIDGRYIVESFSHPGLYYEISINLENMITGCSCPYYLRLRRVCKHILSIFRVFSDSVVLPAQNNFTCTPVPTVVSGQEYFDDPPDQCEAEDIASTRDTIKDQEVFNDRVLAALDTATRIAKTHYCDIDTLRRVLELVEYMHNLEIKPGAHLNAKRQRQK